MHVKVEYSMSTKAWFQVSPTVQRFIVLHLAEHVEQHLIGHQPSSSSSTSASVVRRSSSAEVVVPQTKMLCKHGAWCSRPTITGTSNWYKKV